MTHRTNRGYCRQDGCRASVIWARHEKTGIAAPIDATTAPNGNIEVNEEAGTYRIVPKEERVGRMLHRNHWSTCRDKPVKK